jgi:hypothetical protein
MPGPPRGPSLRMTTTSPALTLPAEDAFAGFVLALEDHAGALEGTKSGPQFFLNSALMPAVLTTLPSGAS